MIYTYSYFAIYAIRIQDGWIIIIIIIEIYIILLKINYINKIKTNY